MDLKKTLWWLSIFLGIAFIVISFLSYSEKKIIREKWVLVQWSVKDITRKLRSEDFFSKVKIQYNCNWIILNNRSKDKTFIATMFINDIVGIYCDPDSDSFVIDRRDTKYITFEYLFYGFILVLLGSWWVVRYLQRCDLKKDWIILKTKISEIIKEKDEDGNIIEYAIVSTYIKDGITYEFKSEEFISTQTIAHVKVWDTVDVWVNYQDYTIYIMDTDALNTQIESKTPEWINIVALIFWIFTWLVSIGLFIFAWWIVDQSIIAMYTLIGFWSVFLLASLYLLNKVKNSSESN